MRRERESDVQRHRQQQQHNRASTETSIRAAARSFTDGGRPVTEASSAAAAALLHTAYVVVVVVVVAKEDYTTAASLRDWAAGRMWRCPSNEWMHFSGSAAAVADAAEARMHVRCVRAELPDPDAGVART